MLFNTVAFLFAFLPLVVVARVMAPAASRQWILAAASVAFIASWGAWSVAATAVAIAVAVGALQIANHAPRLGLLAGLGGLTAILAAPKLVAVYPAATPVAVVGASFITLNLMSVVIDRYRGRIEGAIPTRDVVSFATAFPYIAAGPLVRWRETISQLRNGEPLTSDVAVRALWLIAAGLAKKTLLADQLGLRLDQLLSHGMPPGVIGAWLTTVAFGVQVYFDFSGYTDMALGIGLLLGLSLPPNFNTPYRSTSIADFWRRWHMTLAGWVRDYVYLGLGFGRSHARAMLNMLVAMTLVGLWHGFTWTFIAWGAYHGVLLAFYYVQRSMKPFRSIVVPELAARALTFGAVTVGWAFFRAPSLRDALSLIASMAGGHGVGNIEVIRNYAGAPFVLLAIVGLALTQLPVEPWQLEIRPRLVTGLAVGVIFALAVMALGGQNPFLYMQY
jgi:alginate O-acetyltransferase complex protein AlgI